MSLHKEVWLFFEVEYTTGTAVCVRVRKIRWAFIVLDVGFLLHMVGDPSCKSFLFSMVEKISAAEGAMAFHTVKQHQSYKSMDCTSRVTKSIWWFLEWQQNLLVLGQKGSYSEQCSFHEILLMKSYLHWGARFCNFTDAFKHGYKKMSPLVVQHFSLIKGGHQSKVVEIEALQDETSETIKELHCDIFAFNSNNTKTNFGGLRCSDSTNIF